MHLLDCNSSPIQSPLHPSRSSNVLNLLHTSAAYERIISMPKRKFYAPLRRVSIAPWDVHEHSVVRLLGDVVWRAGSGVGTPQRSSQGFSERGPAKSFVVVLVSMSLRSRVEVAWSDYSRRRLVETLNLGKVDGLAEILNSDKTDGLAKISDSDKN
ncbi:hypothetical protein B296_00009857 [Ensete ventricosum]|uniref:Uncharacterized protein n=1 Tax=Ensete ventricosum TaxID=4639 RepID=A0A427AK15_ENSVE|nr:hypothetical protein B296_00009857 [Ensete ventricosum]